MCLLQPSQGDFFLSRSSVLRTQWAELLPAPTVGSRPLVLPHNSQLPRPAPPLLPGGPHPQQPGPLTANLLTVWGSGPAPHHCYLLVRRYILLTIKPINQVFHHQKGCIPEKGRIAVRSVRTWRARCTHCTRHRGEDTFQRGRGS